MHINAPHYYLDSVIYKYQTSVCNVTCDSPTDAINDCLNVDRVHRRFVMTSFYLIAAVFTVGHSVSFSLWTLLMFLSVNKMTLTSLDECYSATVSIWVLHGSSLHSVSHTAWRFLSRNISQGSVARHFRCGGIFNYCYIWNLLLSLPVKLEAEVLSPFFRDTVCGLSCTDCSFLLDCIYQSASSVMFCVVLYNSDSKHELD